MSQQATLTVTDLLLRSLHDLDAYRDDDWNQQVLELRQDLLRLQSSDSETLGKVVTASAAIQQLLLELAVRPSPGRPRQTSSTQSPGCSTTHLTSQWPER
jgi:hypothetical protein